MWRFLFWLLIGWWLWRLVRPGRRVPPPPRESEERDDPTARDPSLDRLTQQEITDADYEEIPPHEAG